LHPQKNREVGPLWNDSLVRHSEGLPFRKLSVTVVAQLQGIMLDIVSCYLAFIFIGLAGQHRNVSQ